jgi:hypothetical protein
MVVLGLLGTLMAYGGGDNRTGTNAAPELMIPVGARDLAMGGASVATTFGIDAIYWNPAGLARSSKGTSAIFSHMSYIADIPINYFAVSSTFGNFGTLAFSMKALGIGDIPVTTEDFPDGTGQLISPTYVTIGATYSRMLAENIAIGLTTNLITERIARVGATGMCFSAGVQYMNLAEVQGLDFGVAIKNIGPQMQFDGTALLRQGTVGANRQGYYKIVAGSFELPSTIEIGASYRRQLDNDNNLIVSTLFQNNNFMADEYKLGAEYAFRNQFFARAGWDFAQKSSDEGLTATSGVDKTTYLYGPTFGVGVKTDLGDVDLTLDYAYRYVKFLSANQVISIVIGF